MIKKLGTGDHPNPHMQNVYNSHGEFRPELILSLPPDNTQVALEQEWLDKHYGQPGCLNICRSSIGVMSGRKMSEEAKLKMRGKHPSDETRKKFSEARMGHPVSEVTRGRLSLALKGKRRPDMVERNKANAGWHHTDVARSKISEAGKRKCADETRSKISAAHKARGTRPPGFSGRHHTEETLRKLSVAAIGRKFSAKSKQRRSEAMKAAWVLQKSGISFSDAMREAFRKKPCGF